MTKVFEADLLEDTDWIGTHTTVPEWIATFQYKAPEVDMQELNFDIAIPMSKAFAQFPKNPKRIIIFLE